MKNNISYIKSFRFNHFTFQRETASTGPIINLVNIKKHTSNHIIINSQSITTPIELHTLVTKTYNIPIKMTLKNYAKKKR